MSPKRAASRIAKDFQTYVPPATTTSLNNQRQELESLRTILRLSGKMRSLVALAIAALEQSQIEAAKIEEITRDGEVKARQP